MKLFARRSPPIWWLFVTAAVFGGLAVYGVVTGDAFVLGGHRSPSRHILRATDAEAFYWWIRLYATYAAAGIWISFIRLVPVEDGISRWRARSKAAVRERGYDSEPAPLWGYIFLLGFVALIVFLGWKFMYAE